MPQAFVTLAADRVEPGPITRLPDGTVQQVTRLYMGAECVCTLLVTFPKGSPEAVAAAAARTLDGMSPRMVHAVCSAAVNEGQPEECFTWPPHLVAEQLSAQQQRTQVLDPHADLQPPAPTHWSRRWHQAL